MKGYSAFSLMRNALGGHRFWKPVWRTPELKKSYDIVIIGAGGHGLATAYYLAKKHGIEIIAVLEKGIIGGGNTGRNTQMTRSNYFWPQSAAFFDYSLRWNDISEINTQAIQVVLSLASHQWSIVSVSRPWSETRRA